MIFKFFLVFFLLYTAAIRGQSPAPRFSKEDAWKILNAYQQAYPEKKIRLKQENGEFVLQFNKRSFFWLDGRLLPLNAVKESENFSGQSLYPYPLKRPEQPLFSATEEQRFIKRLKENEQKKRRPRHPSFLMNLHDIFNKRQAYAATQLITFLEKKVRVNKKLIPILKKIEQELRTVSAQNAEVANFFAQIENVSGYNWRQTSYFKSISYHSFGLAIDFIPRRWNKPVYWYWSKDTRSDWYNIRYESRWGVPEEVVEIFENYGFIWGGKWLFFDNMHFEYRPELLLLQQSNINWPQYVRDRKLHNENS